MKILLIHPNNYSQRYVSVGIASISAVLKKSGHIVKYFDTSRYKNSTEALNTFTLKDQQKKMEEVLQFIPVELPPIISAGESVHDSLHSAVRSFQPELIGFTATSSDFLQVISIVNTIKEYHIPIIVGGAHATVAPIETLSIDGIDMVCVGEGEEAILELANSIESGQKRTDIKNIYFKSEEQIVTNNVRPYTSLEKLPFPDLDIFDDFHHIGAYQGNQVKYGRFETARGCPYKCSYCINSSLHSLYKLEKRHVRFKSPDRIIAELKSGLDKIGFDIVRFVDETFTASSIKRLSEFVDLYRCEINKPMIIATRPERVSREIMSIIRKAHPNIQITMGIESGSETIRKNICNRHMSNRTIIEAYRICHEYGFHTASFNMVGLPDETRNDFFKTIELNREAKVHQPMLSYFYPFPGTKLREYCINKNYFDEGHHEIDYAVSSVLKMPKFPKVEIEGLKRTFVMYVKMDRTFFPEIQKAEQNDNTFKSLTRVYNSKFLSKK